MPCIKKPKADPNCTPDKPCPQCFFSKSGNATPAKSEPVLKRQNSAEKILAKKKADALPAKIDAGKTAFRGEDEKRSPIDVGKVGFTCWQAKTVEIARTNLQALVSKTDPNKKGLGPAADAWQKFKNKEDGFFFSTGISEEDAYNTYKHFYRIKLPALELRDFAKAGLKDVDAASVEGCGLYTDKPLVAASTFIAVIYPGSKAERSYELLIMTPVATASIEVLKKDPAGFVPLTGVKDMMKDLGYT
jgi:hypothetical protein